MRELHCKKSKSINESKPKYRIDFVTYLNKAGMMKIDERSFDISKELPNSTEEQVVTVLGYVELGKKANQQIKRNQSSSKLVGYINSDIPIHQTSNKDQKVLGYVKVSGMGSYIGIVIGRSKSKVIIPIIAAVLMIGLVGFNLYEPMVIQQPVDMNSFKNGEEKGTGEFTEQEDKAMDTIYFNVNLNVTPTIQNKQMNLRVINSETANNKINILKCVVKVSLIGKADKDGNQSETFENPIEIYETPLLNPSENIEICSLENDVEAGHYIGRAMYYIYETKSDNKLYLIGKTVAKLDIVAK